MRSRYLLSAATARLALQLILAYSSTIGVSGVCEGPHCIEECAISAALLLQMKERDYEKVQELVECSTKNTYELSKGCFEDSKCDAASIDWESGYMSCTQDESLRKQTKHWVEAFSECTIEREDDGDPCWNECDGICQDPKFKAECDGWCHVYHDCVPFGETLTFNLHTKELYRAKQFDKNAAANYDQWDLSRQLQHTGPVRDAAAKALENENSAEFQRAEVLMQQGSEIAYYGDYEDEDEDEEEHEFSDEL